MITTNDQVKIIMNLIKDDDLLEYIYDNIKYFKQEHLEANKTINELHNLLIKLRRVSDYVDLYRELNEIKIFLEIWYPDW